MKNSPKSFFFFEYAAKSLHLFSKSGVFAGI